MNRPPREHTERLLRTLRARIPGLALRTTFISGFPGAPGARCGAALGRASVLEPSLWKTRAQDAHAQQGSPPECAAACACSGSGCPCFAQQRALFLSILCSPTCGRYCILAYVQVLRLALESKMSMPDVRVWAPAAARTCIHAPLRCCAQARRRRSTASWWALRASSPLSAWAPSRTAPRRARRPRACRSRRGPGWRPPGPATPVTRLALRGRACGK